MKGKVQQDIALKIVKQLENFEKLSLSDLNSLIPELQ